jgi:energy-coupling factor transporter transmembrane protein EcfT
MFAMDQQQSKRNQFLWRYPVYVVGISTAIFVALVGYSAYGDWLYMLLVIPVVLLTCLVAVTVHAIRKRSRNCLSALLTLVAFLAVSAVLLKNEVTIRASIRWLVWSRQYKAELLAQPAPPNSQLRHIEWETTGFAGVANSKLYLVFDPIDSLSVARSPGKFDGIPCEVPVVRRLERHWYAVLFYTDEAWGEHNQLNCSGIDP